jgi:hypothetical protein
MLVASLPETHHRNIVADREQVIDFMAKDSQPFEGPAI